MFYLSSMRRLRWLLLLAILAVGVWYWWAPRHAWDAFLGAIVSGDESRLGATIEFPLLRENLRHDLRQAFAERGRANGGEGLGALGGALIDPLVDLTVTPQGLARLVTGFGMRSPRPGEVDSVKAGTETRYRYRGPSRVDVRVRPADAETQSAGIFSFQRFGLSWRLVRVTSDRLADLGEGS